MAQNDLNFWWNWWVQVATALATFLAVLAALFLDWFRNRIFPPELVLTLQNPRSVQAVKAFLNIGQPKPFETMSRWHQVRVANTRRMSRATDTQVCLLEYGLPDANGDYVMRSVGAIPLTVRHEGIDQRIIGRPVEFTLCSVYKEDPQLGKPFFMLHPKVKPTDIICYFDQPFKIALVLQAQSVERDSNLLPVEIIWNGQWSDDTVQMRNNLVFKDHAFRAEE